MTVMAIGALATADQSLPVVLAGKVLFGVGLPWMVIGAFTLLQRVTPPHLQGRTFATAELAIAAPQTALIALGAALVAVLDYRVLIVIQSITVGLAGLYLLRCESLRMGVAHPARARRGHPRVTWMCPYRQHRRRR